MKIKRAKRTKFIMLVEFMAFQNPISESFATTPLPEAPKTVALMARSE